MNSNQWISRDPTDLESRSTWAQLPTAGTSLGVSFTKVMLRRHSCSTCRGEDVTDSTLALVGAYAHHFSVASGVCDNASPPLFVCRGTHISSCHQGDHVTRQLRNDKRGNDNGK